MNPAEWFDLMAGKEDHIVEQVRKDLPDAVFSTVSCAVSPERSWS